jgi:hypothetical protein
MSELNIYKKNRIKEINDILKSNLASLNANYIKNVNVVKKSRSLSNSNKQNIIKTLTNNYYTNLNLIKNNATSAINKINSFIPEFNNSIINNLKNNKKALLIGINYLNTEYELSGCIDDTVRMKEYLQTKGFVSFNIMTDLTSKKPTKINILDEFKLFLSNASNGDILFFYFSGHGSYTNDNNNDEMDKKDEMIISKDLQGVIDDELKTILKNNLKKNVTIVGLFDSCHSGTILDLKYNYLDSNNYDKYSENNKVSECDGNVIMISGCRDSQTSSEALINNKAQGVLTWSFIKAMEELPNSSWREILKYMRTLLKSNKYSQIPQLSTDSFYDIDSKCFI